MTTLETRALHMLKEHQIIEESHIDMYHPQHIGLGLAQVRF